MTRAIAVFFRSLVVDPRSQRAIDETRLDGCYEAAAAKSPVQRALVALRISTLANARRVRWFVVPGVALAYLLGLRAVVMMPNILTTAFGRNASPVILTVGLFAFSGIVLLALVAASVWLTPRSSSTEADMVTATEVGS